MKHTVSEAVFCFFLIVSSVVVSVLKWRYCMVSDPVKEHGFLKELRLSDLVLLIISLLL